MGIYEFNILSQHDKYDLVFTKGHFVDTITQGDYKFVLYSISMFWVEIVYNNSENKLIQISSFISGEDLNKYSDLQGLF